MPEPTHKPTVTYADLKAAWDSLPEYLYAMTTAVTINAIMTYTECANQTERGPATVLVTIPPEDLELLLTLGHTLLAPSHTRANRRQKKAQPRPVLHL